MSQNPSCEMCGGTEYRLDSGFYFCAECNLQSQEFQEQVFEEYFTGAKSTVVTIEKATPKIKAKKRVTSWELLNYVLKGLTDELIELGAPSSLKKTVLRLWVTYLNKLEVAFISRGEEIKPRLNIGFKAKDANIIYGELSKPKRKRRRSRSESSFGSHRSQKRASTSSKKALAKAVYDQTSNRSDASSDTEVSRVLTRNFKFTSAAKKLMSGPISDLVSSSDEGEGQAVSTEKLKNKLKQITLEKRNTVENATLMKIVDIFILALKMEKVNFYKSDFLEWMEEGKLSVANCGKFIPPDVEFSQLLFYKATNLASTDLHLLPLAKLLLIEPSWLRQDPLEGLSDLLRKYCCQLNLPADVRNVIWTLISSEIPKINILDDFDYDGCIVSFILMTLKLLYGLDDVTERSIAPFTREGQLNWEEWVQRRVRILADQALSHNPTRTKFYRNSYEGNPNDALPLLANSPAIPGVFGKHFEEASKRLLPHFIDNKESSSKERTDQDNHRQLDSYLDLEDRLEAKEVVVLKRLGGNFTYIKHVTYSEEFRWTEQVKVELVESSSITEPGKDVNSRSKLRRKNMTENLKDVYLPGYQYWIIHSTHKRLGIKGFEGELSIQERLPVSFYWLLNQMSSLARQTSIALYAELIKYERNLFYPPVTRKVNHL